MASNYKSLGIYGAWLSWNDTIAILKLSLYSPTKVEISGQNHRGWSPSSGLGSSSPTHAPLQPTSQSPLLTGISVFFMQSHFQPWSSLHIWCRTGAVAEGGPAHPDDTLRGALQGVEEWKFLVAGLLWWGAREGGTILTDRWTSNDMYPQ